MHAVLLCLFALEKISVKHRPDLCMSKTGDVKTMGPEFLSKSARGNVGLSNSEYGIVNPDLELASLNAQTL